MHEYRPVNRIAGFFEAMTDSKSTATKETAQRPERTERNRVLAQIVKRNFTWELVNAKLTIPVLHKRLLSMFPDAEKVVSEYALREWKKGNTANPPEDYLEQVAQAFGYDDPRSLQSEEHIARREAEFPRSNAVALAPPPPEQSLAEILPSVGKAIQATDSQTLNACESLISDTESKRLFSFLVFWTQEQFKRQSGE